MLIRPVPLSAAGLASGLGRQEGGGGLDPRQECKQDALTPRALTLVSVGHKRGGVVLVDSFALASKTPRLLGRRRRRDGSRSGNLLLLERTGQSSAAALPVRAAALIPREQPSLLPNPPHSVLISLISLCALPADSCPGASPVIFASWLSCPVIWELIVISTNFPSQLERRLKCTCKILNVI